jgi:hypothetical protein
MRTLALTKRNYKELEALVARLLAAEGMVCRVRVDVDVSVAVAAKRLLDPERGQTGAGAGASTCASPCSARAGAEIKKLKILDKQEIKIHNSNFDPRENSFFDCAQKNNKCMIG